MDTNTTKDSIDVLCVGETLIDFISVEQTDWLLNASTFRRYLGGSPANIAVNVSKLGGSSAILSKTGIGAFGKFIKSELQRHGVSTDYLVMDHRTRTTVAFVSSTSGKPDFEIARSGDYLLRPEEIIESSIRRARVVHASTFALSREPCRSAICKVLRIAHENGQKVSLDPNYSQRIWPHHKEAIQIIEEVYQYVDITKPSLDDARRIFGPDQEPEQYVTLFHELGARIVVLTMGRAGLLVSEAGRIVCHLPSRPVNVADATGAGDSFWAGFLVALLDDEPLERCALFAREVVEMKLTRVGPLPLEIDSKEIYGKVKRTEQELEKESESIQPEAK